MATATQEKQTPQDLLAPETIEFYRAAMDALDEAGVPFLVGGAYAYARYTGIERHTKDFDVWVKADPENAERVYRALEEFGAPVQTMTPDDFAHKGTGFRWVCRLPGSTS